jgi:Flp pilus assembly protein TadG
VSALCVLSDSVAPIWVVWVFAGAALGIMAWRVSRLPRVGRARDAESGFDYTVNLVATLPVLLLLVCLILETTLILTTKLGTLYAAYAAARSGIVWELHGPVESQRKAKQAATLAMAPFSSGLLGNRASAAAPVGEAAIAYAAAYRQTTQGPVGEPYLIAQFVRADGATSVNLEPASESASHLAARVQYRYPFRFRIIGFLLAGSVDPDTGERSWTITTTASLPRQEVLNDPQPLGIPYRSEP